MGISRRSEAIVATFSTSSVARGIHTSSTAPRTMSAYERLLTSSLVQAKWTSSASPASSGAGAMAASRFLTKYSTALTSCWVTFSVSAISAISAGPNSSTTARRASVSSAVRGRTPGIVPVSLRWMSHSTSTWTRIRFSAGSERWSTRAATAGR